MYRANLIVEIETKSEVREIRNVAIIASAKTAKVFVLAHPFEGRLVHEGLAHLWALRFSKREPATFSFSVNDYGFEMLGPIGYEFRSLFDDDFFSNDQLQNEVGHSIDIGEMSQRQFREIAQIAGLVFTGYPGSPKTGRQKQVSSSLLYEVLFSSLEVDRMRKTMERMGQLQVRWIILETPSPLAFPHFGRTSRKPLVE